MGREAFLPNADVRKAPKRIKRLGLILKNDRGREGRPFLAILPRTESKVAALPDKERQELFGVRISQFVEAYNLRQDKELATYFDNECVTMMSKPPKLPDELAGLLDAEQTATAADIAVAHGLSGLMKEHWGSRNEFFAK
jgi:hypothetical protein